MLGILLVIVVAFGEFRVPNTETEKHRTVIKEGIKKFSPKIQILPCDKGNCAYATSDIESGEEIISIPLPNTLTLFDPCPLYTKDTPTEYRLYYHIIYYKFMDRSRSLLNAGINLGPIEYDIPLNWTDSDFDLYNSLSLFGYPVSPKYLYKEMCDYFISENKEKRNKLPPELFECESWKWVQSFVQTRRFGASMNDFHGARRYIGKTLNDEISVDNYIPIFDMLNHKHRDPKEKTLKIVNYLPDPSRVNYYSIRDVKEGDEIYSNYGLFNSYQLVTGYGFFIPDNIDDGLSINKPAGNCREDTNGNQCKFMLYVDKLNPNFLLYITDNIPHSLWESQLSSLALKLENHKSLQEGEENAKITLVLACIKYRFELANFYLQATARPLRLIRREFTGLANRRERMIFEYCENERKILFNLMRSPEKALLNLLHSLLFK